MKDKVKCSVIDAMMLGHEVGIRYSTYFDCWSLVTTENAERNTVFQFRYEEMPLTVVGPITLKHALELIDRHWEDRLL